MAKKAIFPGSFDPFTLGHKFVVDQALHVFDKIIIAIGANSEKRGLLTVDNRVKLIRDIYADDPRIEVKTFDGLTADFCRNEGVHIILRGLRNSVDFEYERNISQVNQTLYPKLQTILIFTPAKYVAISSSVIRELVSLGADPAALMPKNIDIKNYL